MPEDILLKIGDSVATVTFNRPGQRNAISYSMWLELQRLAVDLEHDPSVRVVVFTGAGKDAFSAGADIKDFDLYRDISEKAKLYAAASEGAMERLAAFSKPTIALVRGYCVGGGCELAATLDLRVAAENARFGVPAARLGITIGYREMRRLVQLIGPGVTSHILLTARLLDAQEALRVGLANAVLPLEEVEEYTYKLAQEVASLGPLAHRYNKEVLRTVLANPALAGLTPEAEHLPFRVFDSEDYREGRRAFLEKRRPRFGGR
ncbi:MAG: enoyl-CoA hydratase/isomerase family protein [Chloroflexi bacterium]|nr:enoyl-CoA hydratase/isomerase family protein [Chloroflexota bacterium]